MNNNDNTVHVLKSIGVEIKYPTQQLLIDTSKLTEKELVKFYKLVDKWIREGRKNGTIYE